MLTPQEFKQIETAVALMGKACDVYSVMELLKSYVGEPAAVQAPVKQLSAIEQHVAEIEKARAEFRKRREPEEEASGVRMVELADEPGTLVPVPAAMPEGARTFAGGVQVELRGGKLHAVEAKKETGTVVAE